MSLEYVHYKEKPNIQCFMVMINYRMAHYHNDFEILYVLKGSVIIERKDKVNALHTHDIFIIERNVVHSLRKTSEDNLLLVLQFNLSNFTDISPDFLQIRLNKHLFTPDGSAQYATLKMLFQRMLDNHAQPPMTRALKNMQLICDTCILFSEKLDHSILSESDFAREERNNILLSELMNYIHQNYAHTFTLSDFGRQQGFSAHYLSRFFKENMGITFSRYLSSVRTSRAEYLITHTEKSLLDICMECGFSNTSYFNKAFFEDYGCRPSEYLNTPISQTLYFATQKPSGESQHIIADAQQIKQYIQNPNVSIPSLMINMQKSIF